MNISIQQILNSKEFLGKLGSQKMGAITAYKIQRNISVLNDEIRNFESTIKSLAEQYGTLKDGVIEFTENKKEEYNKEINNLLNLEVEIDIHPIKIEDVNCEVTPFELMSIKWMLE